MAEEPHSLLNDLGEEVTGIVRGAGAGRRDPASSLLREVCTSLGAAQRRAGVSQAPIERACY
jgi:hypothetical protein